MTKLPNSEYLQRRIRDSSYYILHKRGIEPTMPDPVQLRLWGRMLMNSRLLHLARRRQKDAEARIDRLRKLILQDRGDSQLAGFIGSFGKDFYRVLFVTTEKQPKLEQPRAFIDHVGKQLPDVVNNVTVTLDGAEYLQFAKWYRRTQGNDAASTITGVDVNLDALEYLTSQERLEPPPAGIFATPEPTISIVVDLIKEPSTRAKRRR